MEDGNSVEALFSFFIFCRREITCQLFRLAVAVSQYIKAKCLCVPERGRRGENARGNEMKRWREIISQIENQEREMRNWIFLKRQHECEWKVIKRTPMGLKAKKREIVMKWSMWNATWAFNLKIKSELIHRAVGTADDLPIDYYHKEKSTAFWATKFNSLT